jgi:hypothetical protein
MKPAVILIWAILHLSSCGLFKGEKAKDPKEKPTPTAPKLVGRIASIPAHKRFVLIQAYEKWNVETGSILTTRGPDDRTANLRATGESLGQFAAADLQSGTLEVGDAVYSQHVPKPQEPESPAPATDQTLELPENQQKAESENVQKNN